MDKPSCSRSVTTSDPDFSDKIRRLLGHGSDFESSDSYDDVDDSDKDPDFVLPLEENTPRYNIVSDDQTDESEEDEAMLDLQHMDMNNMQDSTENNSVRHHTTLPRDELPDYFFERTKKTEAGPPNAWTSMQPPRQVRTPARNIIRTGFPGIRGSARLLGNKPKATEVWNLLFDKDIIDTIVVNTNKKLQSEIPKLGDNTNKSNYRETNSEEINALIGMLILSSVLKSNDEQILSLFSKDSFSRPIFSATMSEKRYLVLTASLRFDDAETRMQRKETDKTAPISELFEKFISNCQRMYCVSSEVTIDEMLVPFRGRCSFKVYMPKKPKKYGIKVMCLADAKTSYLLNAYIYSGKGSDSIGLTEAEKQLSIPTQSIVRLCRPIQGTNRNVTGDNWFTPIEAVDELLKRKLTYVGTMRRDKKQIPEQFLQNPRRPVGSSLYGFRSDITLLSYVPKKNRAVILASSMHHRISNDEDKKKPEMISYYNSTKCGVDLLDMKCAIFSSSRRTRRWPLAIFYRLLSIGTVNSFIMYMSFKDIPDMTRFDFIKMLGFELIVPHLRTRLTNTNLPRELRSTIHKVIEKEDKSCQPRPQQASPQEVPSDKMSKRKTCATCPWVKQRKTVYMCIECKKPVCLECSRKVCLDCAKEK